MTFSWQFTDTILFFLLQFVGHQDYQRSRIWYNRKLLPSMASDSAVSLTLYHYRIRSGEYKNKALSRRRFPNFQALFLIGVDMKKLDGEYHWTKITITQGKTTWVLRWEPGLYVTKNGGCFGINLRISLCCSSLVLLQRLTSIELMFHVTRV